MARRDLAKHLQTLADEIDGETGRSCRVSTRSSKASDEPRCYWICGIDEHDRNFSCQRQCGRDIGCVHCNDHIGLQRQKLSRGLAYPLDLIAEQSALDDKVLTLHVAEPCKGCLHN